jgi:hypothetical protein
MQALESGLAKVPGGAGPMARSGESFSTDMGSRVQSIADNLAPNADSTLAGNAIERGIRSFASRFKGEQQFLYNKLDHYIPGVTRIDASHTKAALQTLTADIQGAKELSKLLRNKKVADIAEAFQSDAGQAGQLPYSAVKQIRSLVGNAIADGPLVGDIPSAQLKQLYAALSRDMEGAAQAAGPAAQQAFERASRFTRAGHARIDEHLDRLVGKTADETFNAMMRGGDPSKVAATLRSLQPAERDIVKATVVSRLGMASAGQQNAAGDVFSAATFLTSWNRLNPRAKLVLFSGKDGALRENLDQVAKAAEYAREAGRVFANPSGTAGAIANYTGAITAGSAAVTGNIGAAGLVLGGMMTANATAKILTHPPFVGWLARATKLPSHALPAALNTLGQIAAKERDPDLQEEIRRIVESVEESLR